MATAPRHCIYGGSLTLTYQILTEQLRHHDEANMRPQFIDHMVVTMLLGTFVGFVAMNSARGALQGLMVSTVLIGPGTYWMKKVGLGSYDCNRPANIYYQNDVTPEEVERIRMQDEAEALAWNMSIKPGYGLIHKGRSNYGI